MRNYFGMKRVLPLLGIAALIASPASAGLKPDPKPFPRPQPAPPPPPPPRVFQRVTPAPVVVHPTAAERAAATRREAATRRAVNARAVRLAQQKAARVQAALAKAARAKAARAKAARNAARTKAMEARRDSHLREAIASPSKATTAVSDPLLPVLFGFTIGFLILAASPVSAIPWHGAARVLVARRQVFALIGAGGLVAVVLVMVL